MYCTKYIHTNVHIYVELLAYFKTSNHAMPCLKMDWPYFKRTATLTGYGSVGYVVGHAMNTGIQYTDLQYMLLCPYPQEQQHCKIY